MSELITRLDLIQTQERVHPVDGVIKELRLDFNNDTHASIEIQTGEALEVVVSKLHSLIESILIFNN
jgi:hypothetical protein